MLSTCRQLSYISLVIFSLLLGIIHVYTVQVAQDYGAHEALIINNLIAIAAVIELDMYKITTASIFLCYRILLR